MGDLSQMLLEQTQRGVTPLDLQPTFWLEVAAEYRWQAAQVTMPQLQVAELVEPHPVQQTPVKMAGLCPQQADLAVAVVVADHSEGPITAERQET